ncbi:MAG: hypothetical protein J6M12_03365 [Clostridia bacterium]|nr:hypothetical protein [Clostridia bacterium]
MSVFFKKLNKKAVLTVALCLLISVAAVSGVWAYLVSKTDTKTNTFIPGSVTCAVEEDFQNGVKSDVKIRNTGNVNAYIRVAVVATFVSDEGKVHATAPVEGTDYTVIWASDSWKKGTDGFWYHSSDVAPDALTSTLIKEATALAQPPDGFRLNLQIVASAVQSDPPAAVNEAWGITPLNGKILPN